MYPDDYPEDFVVPADPEVIEAQRAAEAARKGRILAWACFASAAAFLLIVGWDFINGQLHIN